MLNRAKTGAATNQLDIVLVPPSFEPYKCTDERVKQEALKYYTALSSDKYLEVVHETPIPRLTEVAFNKFPGSEDECQRKAASITGGAKFHKVLI